MLTKTFEISENEKIGRDEINLNCRLHLTGEDVTQEDADNIKDKLKWINSSLPIGYEIGDISCNWRIDRVVLYEVHRHICHIALYLTEIDKETGIPTVKPKIDYNRNPFIPGAP